MKQRRKVIVVLLNYCSSEANAATLHQRFTLVKSERDALEADSKGKLQLLLQKLREIQTQYKFCAEQLNTQSKQCEHLNGENKQLVEYVVGILSSHQ